MAGTPTTNYNIPTYADTDAPDLSGAYNDAMGIIDTQLKANADAIESASTGNYTGTAPITVDNEGRTISVMDARLNPDGTDNGRGVVKVFGKADYISTGANINDAVVPNARAVADYVAAHGGTKYTAGDGIGISGDTIYIEAAQPMDFSSGTGQLGKLGGVSRLAIGDDGNSANLIDSDADWNSALSAAVPTVGVLKDYVERKMAAAGAAYTGTAPVVVDNGSHTISVNRADHVTYDSGDNQTHIAGIGVGGIVTRLNGSATSDAIVTSVIDDDANDWYQGNLVYVVPTIGCIKNYVASHTPDASTTVKGLVQLANGTTSGQDGRAVTPEVIRNMKNGSSLTGVTVALLSSLQYDPNTGIVFCKPSN